MRCMAFFLFRPLVAARFLYTICHRALEPVSGILLLAHGGALVIQWEFGQTEPLCAMRKILGCASQQKLEEPMQRWIARLVGLWVLCTALAAHGQPQATLNAAVPAGTAASALPLTGVSFARIDAPRASAPPDVVPPVPTDGAARRFRLGTHLRHAPPAPVAQLLGLGSLLAGLMALAALRRVRPDASLGWLGLAGVCWGVFLLLPPQGAAADARWDGTLAALQAGLGCSWLLAAALACAPPRPRRLMLGLAVGGVALGLTGGAWARAWLPWLDASVLLALSALLLVQAAKAGLARTATVAAVLVPPTLLALLDVSGQGPPWPTLLRWAPLALLLLLPWWLGRRHAKALQRVEAGEQEMARRLIQQREALTEQLQHEAAQERRQALLQERQRLMQDMHDGLGSSLLSAMVAVEQGTMGREQVVDVLRECVDDLRLVIDSLEPVGHDLVALLATMRYRLGKRMQLGGVKLDWDVQDLPPLPWLEPPDALQVLRLMQEAITNALKHSHASRIRLVTRDMQTRVEIRVEDNGEGFDVERIQHGRGLRGLQRRARKLGGSLRVDSSVGHGTVVTLRLPIDRRDSEKPWAAEGPIGDNP